MNPVSTRLVRLLNMVPYFQANPGVTRAKAAADLGVTVKQLEQDVNQLFVCGQPGYYPDDLIDFAFVGDTIEVTFSAGIDHPLRLTSPEATGLLVALRALADIAGVVDPAAARSAIAKIESAAGATASSSPAAADEPAPTDNQATGAVRDAVREHRALAIDYYAASHDTMSHRVVDPIRVAVIGNHSYLEAWCRAAEAVRLFRFDRVVAATVLDEASAAPQPAAQAPTDTSLFTADPTLPAATLRVAPTASWMFEYYPMRVVRELSEGYCEAAMTYVSDEWMTRLMLGFGPEVTVLAPAALAARVRDAATAAVAAHEAAYEAGRCG